MDNIKDSIKLFLDPSLSNVDNILDELISETESELKFLLHLEDEENIPNNLLFILKRVVRARYNRIGSEGMTSQIVEGYSSHFSNKNDFNEYKSYIDDYLVNKDKKSRYAHIQVW